MGQLEKYGLYVLVLLAFLIIGVAIWGKPSEAGGSPPHNPLSAQTNASKTPPANAGGNQPGGVPAANGGTAGLAGPGNPSAGVSPQPRDLSKALTQAPPVEPKKDDANKKPATGGEGPKVAGSESPTTPPGVEDQKRPEYKVKTGESFERIAREQLGHAGMTAELAKLNSKIEPTRLRAGQVILLPSKAEVAAWVAARAPKKAATDPKAADPKTADPKAADPKTGRPQPTVAGKATYTVARGDTFEGIARRVLGDPKRASDIQELNPEVTPRSMKIGTVLKMPGK